MAADVGSVPDGLTIADVSEFSTDGRRISYRAIDPGPYGDDGWQVQITTRVPMEWTVEKMLQAYEQMPEDQGVGDVEVEVRGHRAVVAPATDDGRQYGWEVRWEEAPGVQVHVRDVRHDVEGRQTATRESVLALAEGVQGLDRAGWDAALGGYQAADPHAGPPEGAVERPVADGVLDGRQWTLSVLEDPAGPEAAFQGCFRLAYAGEDTGPACSVQRVVLSGKGFVIGWTGLSGEAPDLQAGPGSSFEPIRPQVHSFGVDPEWHVWIAVLPDGACGVEYRHPQSSPIDTAIPLNLLPGDPGSVECSTG
jgi:hypothetical protein